MRAWRWRSAGIVLLAIVTLTQATPANALTGALDQLSPPDACVSDDGTAGDCEDGAALVGASWVTVAPGGRHVYATSKDDNAIVTFGRDRTTGDLDMLSCISDSGAGSCDDGVGLDRVRNLAISANGKNVYAIAGFSNALTIFRRNRSTGELTQLGGTSGCIADTGTTECADGNALGEPEAVVVSRDGRNVYVASGLSNAVAVFKRNTRNGALRQLAGADGCISEGGALGCEAGAALTAPYAMAISPDGRSIYVAAGVSNAVAALSRNARTGKLDQPGGTDACVSDTGSGGCENGFALQVPEGVAVSRDGKNVYVTSGGSSSVAAFSRNRQTSALDQLQGVDACVSESGGDGCEDGSLLNNARALAVSADGKTVYVAAGGSNAIVALNRTPTGALDQIVGVDGCVSETGDTGACENGVALLGPDSVAVSQDGRRRNRTLHVYVASTGSNAVDAFSRAQS